MTLFPFIALLLSAAAPLSHDAQGDPAMGFPLHGGSHSSGCSPQKQQAVRGGIKSQLKISLFKALPPRFRSDDAEFTPLKELQGDCKAIAAVCGLSSKNAGGRFQSYPVSAPRLHLLTGLPSTVRRLAINSHAGDGAHAPFWSTGSSPSAFSLQPSYL